jgi:hypothetical protein
MKDTIKKLEKFKNFMKKSTPVFRLYYRPLSKEVESDIRLHSRTWFEVYQKNKNSLICVLIKYK